MGLDIESDWLGVFGLASGSKHGTIHRAFFFFFFPD